MQKKIFVLCIGILITLASCSKRDFVQVAPNICPTPAFKFVNHLTVNKSVIDFSTDSVLHFEGSFNEPVYWTLLIRSKSTAAIKTFKGYSSAVSINWYGDPDYSNALFGAGDCEAILSPSCIDASSSVDFTISKKSDFSKFGIVVFDFDKNNLGAPYFTLNPRITIHSSTGPVSGNVTQSPKGGSFYNMTFSAPQNTPVWYFGGKTMPSINLGKFINESPDNLYLNFYLNVNGKSSTQTVVTFYEGAIQRQSFINGNFSGWKLISIKLSDMYVDDVSKITALDFGVGAFPAQATEAEVNLDFVIITKGVPFAK